MTESVDVVVARIDERLIAVERDIKEIKSRRPSWPQVVSALVAAAALILTLILNL